MTIGKLESVSPAGDSKLAVTFDDGLLATIDLSPVLAKHPALAPLAEPAVFKEVRLSADGWSIEWPDLGMDFGAQQLRRWADEQSGRTMSPEKFREWMQRNKLTLDATSEALDLSRRTVAYYLSGEQPIPRTVMLATEALEARQFA